MTALGGTNPYWGFTRVEASRPHLNHRAPGPEPRNRTILSRYGGVASDHNCFPSKLLIEPNLNLSRKLLARS